MYLHQIIMHTVFMQQALDSVAVYFIFETSQGGHAGPQSDFQSGPINNNSAPVCEQRVPGWGGPHRQTWVFVHWPST